MVKYMIQDIIPPERRGVRKVVHKDAPHKKSEAPSRPHGSIPEEQPLHTTVSHVLHHEQHTAPEAEEVTHEKEEEPQNAIIENLYRPHEERREVAQTPPPSIPVSSGVYPYNTATVSSSSGDKPSWKFPETSSFTTKFGGWAPWVLIPLVVIVGGVFALNHFAGATILLIPKHDNVLIPSAVSWSALKNPVDGELGFSVMKVTLDDSKEVNATGTKTVTAKASGKIVIYNEQTATQRLIKNTRFESAAGKIYRINDSINVPKAVTKSGKVTPGTIEVTVYADEAGPDYNSAPTDFTVPGLKNTPQAKKVYGRSNGPVAGGGSGTTKSVSDQELKQAGEDLRVSLETKLRGRARADLAASQIAYDQGIVIALEDPKLSSEAGSAADKAVVTETGSLYMVVFDRDMLTKSIAKKLIPTYGGEDITITNLESLQLGMTPMKGDVLAGKEKLDLTFTGTPAFLWQIDEEKIKKELTGVQKTNFNLILSQYPNVERAKASIQPIWKGTFPSEESAITVKLVEEIPN